MQSTNYTSSSSYSAPVVERVLLPTQIVEKPVAIHEEIRKELVEEIQPVVNVEKYKTEVHQVTQPLFDKEVRAVSIEQRTLATEVLPEVLVSGRGVNQAADVSTTQYLDTTTVVVEKPAMFREVERKQIIEEIQPVIYKETVIPEVIQETKPIYQKIVEGPVYSHTTMASRQVANPSMIATAYVPDSRPLPSTQERMLLPTQIVEKPAAIHEEIRKEVIEEIQPVVNVEKIKTEVHQITAPLFDKEVRPVEIQRRTLATEILPEVLVEGRGVRTADDYSTTVFQASKQVVIEKPARMIEVERTQVIEEIQPVIYKETVVPHVIRETKPVYQKIVEGPVYTQETLPARNLRDTNYVAPVVVAPVIVAPVIVERVVVPEVVSIPIVDETPRSTEVPLNLPARPLDNHRKEIVEDTTTVTTTTTIAPVLGANMGAHDPLHTSASGAKQHRGLGGLFHRHSKDQSKEQSKEQQGGVQSTDQAHLGPYGTTAQPLHASSAPLGTTTTSHTHTEQALPNGAKVVEESVTTTSHNQKTVHRV